MRIFYAPYRAKQGLNKLKFEVVKSCPTAILLFYQLNDHRFVAITLLTLYTPTRHDLATVWSGSVQPRQPAYAFNSMKLAQPRMQSLEQFML